MEEYDHEGKEVGRTEGAGLMQHQRKTPKSKKGPKRGQKGHIKSEPVTCP
jgi:hypothetical protein